ncbi:MAG: enoyl-CoA hydratase-related protein [Alphaproteobacteria bacterium]
MSVDYEIREEFAVITLNRPDALNALNAVVMATLDRLFDEVASSKARALLITGAGGRSFCAGADISGLGDATTLEHRAKMHDGQRIVGKLEMLPQASIAVIDGYAFGGGLELALACSFRLATAKSKVGLPEVKLGLLPGYGGTQRLPRLIGESRALDMVMTGRAVEADEALSYGLVNQLISEDDPIGEAMTFARRFTQFGMPILRYGRAAVQAARETSLADGLKAEADIGALAYGTNNAREGIAAFLEKRKADYKDD